MRALRRGSYGDRKTERAWAGGEEEQRGRETSRGRGGQRERERKEEGKKREREGQGGLRKTGGFH